MKQVLFSGSIILMVGSSIANVINYFYHLIIGRLLGPAGYGELVALISLSGLLSILPASINLVVVKYVSASETKEEQIALITWLRLRIFQLSIILFILLLLIAPFIRSFLHISHLSYIVAVAITFLFSLLTFYNRSVLQGLLKFKEISISIVSENSIRFAVSVLLILLGYQVGGAMIGLVTSVFIAWYITNGYLKTPSRKNQKALSNVKSMIMYSIPVAVQSIALTSFYSSDLILVKHFFSSYEAGMYAALSTLGKIILFGAGPISAVMFPIVAQRYSKSKEYRKIIILSFLATLIFATTVLIIYFLFPQFAINLLYGAAYLEASNLLIWFGIFMTLFTICSLLISFHLSVGHTNVVFLPAIASVAQILAIWFYHTSLFIVIMISVFITALLLSFLLIYSFYKTGRVYETKISIRDKFNIRNSSGI